LKIPIDQELNKSDDFNLLEALEAVAKVKGYKKGRRFLKKELGCSGNSVKNMMRTETYPWTYYWDINEYRTKDAYRCVRRIDKEKYAEMINLIVSEYVKIATIDQRNKLLEYLNNYNIPNPSYQMALCYRSIKGLRKIVSDQETANRVNKIIDAQDIANIYINALENGLNIKP